MSYQDEEEKKTLTPTEQAELNDLRALCRPEFPPPNKPLILVSRKEWGALPPKTTESHDLPLTNVVFTYNTGGKVCKKREECEQRMRELQLYHQQDVDISDIAFNFLVGGDGIIYEGRGWDVKSSKYLKLRRCYGKRLDIAFIGNHIGTEFIPQRVLRPVYQLILKGIDEGKLVKKYKLYQARHKPILQTYYYSPLYEDPQYLRCPPEDPPEDQMEEAMPVNYNLL